MIWFSADHHLSHEAMIDYVKRPFKRVGKMNNAIIDRHNKVVDSSDTVYFLGDLTIVGPSHRSHVEYLIHQLKGTKILILGNHDKFNPFTYVDMGFQSVHTYLKVEEFNLIHDPAAYNIATEEKWLCGHIHILFKRCKNALNVGVDVWDFYPVSITTVREEFNEDHPIA